MAKKAEVTKEDLEYAMWKNLRLCFKPHKGQLPILEAAFLPPFGKGIKRVFIRCGRKFGKSTISTYLSYQRALFFPGSECYLLAPQYKQAKEIYWTSEQSGLVPSFLNLEGQRSPFVTKIDNQDTRVELYNGSFIKVDGSDNFESQRGWNPDQVVGDEFANFYPEWYNVMVPNLASKNGTLVLIGTPPEYPVLQDGTDHQYVQIDREWREKATRGKAFWIHAPSTSNTTIFTKPEMKEWLQEERDSLYGKNLGFIYEREYNAEIVFGGAQAVFPAFAPATHIKPHSDLLADLRGKKLEYWVGADPAIASCFAVGFLALDRATGTPYWLDELYVTDKALATTDAMAPLIKEKMLELNPDLTDWNLVCDSAASWFIEEAGRHGLYFMPSHKQTGDKQEGISLLREIFRLRTGIMSDRCQNTKAEFLNYRTTDKGQYIKLHDHEIDLARYILKISGLEVFGIKPVTKVIDFERDRGRYLKRVNIEEDLNPGWPGAVTGSTIEHVEVDW